MRQHDRWRMATVASAALVAVLALGACGGSDSSGATTTAGGATSSPAATTAGTTAGTTVADAPTTTDPNFSGEGSEEFCQYIEDVSERQDELDQLFAASSTPDEVEQYFTTLDGLFDEAISRAPGEIKGDFETSRGALVALREVFASVGYDGSKLMAAMADDPELAAKLQVVQEPEFVAATDRIAAYGEKVCGIKPE